MSLQSRRLSVERTTYDYSPKWDYVGTGRLRLSIESIPYGVKTIRKSWGDGRTQQLESCLGDFIVTLPQVAAAIKFDNEERERRHQRWMDEQKRAEEERRLQAEYDRKSEVVNKLAQAWREARLFREFAAALKQELRSPAVAIERKLGVMRIVDWTERHANFLDPLVDLADTICQFDDQS